MATIMSNKERAELYAQLAQGNFNSLSLQKLKQELNGISEGKQTIRRYSEDNGAGLELLEGAQRAGEIHQAAAIICGADESASRREPSNRHGKDGRGRETEKPIEAWYKEQRLAGKRQEELLQKYAETTDCWYQLDNLDETAIISSGGESVVYRYDEKTVLKVNTLRYTISPQILLDRITLHNAIFDSTAMEVLGFGRNEFGEFCVIYTQPFIEGKAATQEQIKNLISSACNQSIESYHFDGTNYKNNFILFDDLHQENVLIDQDGHIQVIDSDIKFNVPELGLGGRYKIPSALPNPEIKNTQKENNMANNIHLEGILHSCETSPSQTPGHLAVRLQICTAKLEERFGRKQYVNPVFHRVALTVSGEQADTFRQMEAKCKECNAANWKNPNKTLNYASAISIKGHLVIDNNNEPVIIGDKNTVSFPETLKMKNMAEITGKVTKVVCNDFYSSMTVKAYNPNKHEIEIPVTLFKSTNPQKWSEIMNGKVSKNSNVSFKGAIMSNYYENGDQRIWRCVLNATDCVSLKKAKTQKASETPSL